jgi:hypothetical protein
MATNSIPAVKLQTAAANIRCRGAADEELIWDFNVLDYRS